MWFDFSIVIVMQACVYLVVALYVGIPRPQLLHKLPLLLLIGLLYGILIDVLFGKYFSIFTYELGFDPFFVVANGLLSYGFWVATVAQLSQKSFLQFYIVTIVAGAVYEFFNYFFKVWEWSFYDQNIAEYLVVVFAGYCGVSLPMIALLTIFKIEKFDFLTKISK